MTRPLALCLALALAMPLALTGAEKHDHDHAGHDHAKEHAGHEHGAMTALGSATLGTLAAAVTAGGAPAAGKEWHVGIALPADAPAPKALRAWVGSENGRGSEKARAQPEAGHPGEYEAHVAVPAPLPADAKLWLALEDAAGVVSKASLDLPAAGAAKPGKHDHDHGDHDHDHPAPAKP